jgi:hypothetical protein
MGKTWVNPLLVLVGCAVVLPVTGLSSAAEIPFSCPADHSNGTVNYSVRLYQGYGFEGPLVLELSGWTHSVEGIVEGSVTVDDDGHVTRLTIDELNGGTTAPMYADAYVEGVHLEAYVPHVGVSYFPQIIATDPNGLFETTTARCRITPDSHAYLTLADLLTYDLAQEVVGMIGYDAPISGSVTFVEGEPFVKTLLTIANAAYLGYFGYDYTVAGELIVSINTPEPSSALLLLAPGLLALRRRLWNRRSSRFR